MWLYFADCNQRFKQNHPAYIDSYHSIIWFMLKVYVFGKRVKYKERIKHSSFGSFGLFTWLEVH